MCFYFLIYYFIIQSYIFFLIIIYLLLKLKINQADYHDFSNKNYTIFGISENIRTFAPKK
jgi:hypothetical protein